MRSAIVLAAVVAQVAGSTAPPPDPQALQRMVATERAFAAATAEIGVRDGFLAFFADDAVQIRRDTAVSIGPARAALAALALPKLPLATRLLWEPFTGHVSADGSFGWLTGGYVAMSEATKETVSQGAYFSVWKRQSNGTWRVWLDEGVSFPQIWRDAAPFRVAPEPDAGDAGTPAETLDAAESAIASDVAAWRNRLATGARLHIDRQMPLVGRDAIASSPRAAAGVTYRRLRSETAGSGDLAVAIGSYESVATGVKSAGSWVRVWKRDTGGRWRIVFQTETALA